MDSETEKTKNSGRMEPHFLIRWLEDTRSVEQDSLAVRRTKHCSRQAVFHFFGVIALLVFSIICYVDEPAPNAPWFGLLTALRFMSQFSLCAAATAAIIALIYVRVLLCKPSGQSDATRGTN